MYFLIFIHLGKIITPHVQKIIGRLSRLTKDRVEDACMVHAGKQIIPSPSKKIEICNKSYL
jgi:hypothetical protein